MYEKLGIPCTSRRCWGVAVDAVFDSVSVATTFRSKLAEAGVIFCPISEAVHSTRNWCANIWARWCRARTTITPRSTARCSAMARLSTSPGACAARWNCRPISVSTRPDRPVRTHPDHRRRGAVTSVTSRAAPAPMRDENQLHAAVVELVALDGAQIKYSTVQNWYPGDAQGAAAFTIS